MGQSGVACRTRRGDSRVRDPLCGGTVQPCTHPIRLAKHERSVAGESPDPPRSSCHTRQRDQRIGRPCGPCAPRHPEAHGSPVAGKPCIHRDAGIGWRGPTSQGDTRSWASPPSTPRKHRQGLGSAFLLSLADPGSSARGAAPFRDARLAETSATTTDLLQGFGRPRRR